jgi:hypothetical protein
VKVKANVVNFGIMSVVLLGIVILWSWADVYMFEDGSVFTTGSQTGDAVMRLEATGEDLRVYEFTPQTAPNKQCLFVAGGEGKGGLFCFDKVTVPVTP